MTTIAYNHEEKKIACDGRLTAAGAICTDECQKYVVADDFTMFFCGSFSDVDRMAAIVKDHTTGDIVDIESEVKVEVFIIRDGRVFNAVVNSDFEYSLDELTYSYAIGSGGCFALSAMDFGRSAKEAVKYAMTRDSFTGGKISVCDIKTGKIK